MINTSIQQFGHCVASIVFQTTLCLLAIGLGIATPSNGTAALAEGITNVTANAQTITLTGTGDGGAIRILELQAQEFPVPTQLKTEVARIPKATAFSISVPRLDGARDRLFSSFIALRDANASDRVIVGTNRFVETMTGIATYTNPYPTAASKKGLQVQMVPDAIALGIKHAALNINFSQMIDLTGKSNSPTWTVDGEVVHFSRSYVESLDRQIRPLTDAKIVVSLILLVYESGNPKLNEILLHPQYDKQAPNRLGAFNTVTPQGVLHFKACIEFLAHRYGDPTAYDGRVANFILGNEVNSHWFWSNMGRVPMTTFADDHLRAARIANTSLRKVSTSARLFLSLEHHWNIRYPGGKPGQAFPGREFLDYFGQRAREQGDFDWHLAFHPYPENLFEPRTWNDKSATTNDHTPRITFKNLEVLPRYLRRPELLYRGTPRRIILSEQGFHTVDKPEGELWQAAAYAYAYYKTANLPEIDSFILHRHVDHGQEGGLNLGLWTRNPQGRSAAEPASKKKIYSVFQAADTPDWRSAFEFALPVIGIQHWEDLLPRPAN